jgi:hypothetical protein
MTSKKVSVPSSSEIIWGVIFGCRRRTKRVRGGEGGRRTEEERRREEEGGGRREEVGGRRGGGGREVYLPCTPKRSWHKPLVKSRTNNIQHNRGEKEGRRRGKDGGGRKRGGRKRGGRSTFHAPPREVGISLF